MGNHVWVTGSTCSIGNHTCLVLLEAGCDLIDLNNFSNSTTKTLTTLLNQGPQNLTYNLGSGNRASVLDIINASSAARGQEIPCAL